MNEKLTDIDIRFVIKIDSCDDGDDIINLLLSKLDSACLRSKVIITASGNVFMLEQNFLYGETPDPEDGIDDAWLYYKWDLCVFPESDVTLNHQIILAKRVLCILNEASFITKLLTEFEI